MLKTFVLDTNVLLHNAQSIESFQDNMVVLPMAVIEELDKFKKNADELGRNARQVIRKLDELRSKGSLSKGVELDNANGQTPAGKLKIMTGVGSISGAEEMDYAVPDNKILRAAYQMHKKGEDVILITKDINLRLKADALGIPVEDFEKQKVNFDELFSGQREMEIPGEKLEELYQNRTISFDDPSVKFYPNEFVLLKNDSNPKQSALSVAKSASVLNLLGQKGGDDSVWNIRPRSKEQRMALHLLMDPEVQIVTLVGQAGSGKTLLALAAGLELVVKMKLYEKILVSRPIVPLGKDIGYLPGGKDEKLSHWMQPIFDNLDYLMHAEKKEMSVRKYIDELMRNHVLEMEALTYIRGRSIPKQYVIVDEAQNLTPHEVKTIVSRAGEGTKMVLTGDPYQIDNPYLDASSNGLSYAVERLKPLSIHGHVTLRKSERSELAAAAAEFL